MNNYCTNCGKQLKKNVLVCKNCNTPIIELPYNYEYKSPKKKEIRKRIIIILVICILIIFSYYLIMVFINNFMSEKLQKEYVEPYLEQNYSNLEYSIEFETTGKCIISGNCYKEPLIECDGNGCRLYEYLSIFECKSYFYTINVQDTETIITVFRKDGEYKLVEGRNIYEIDEEEDELKLKDLFDKDNTKLNNEEFIKKEESINNYPYESSYYTFASAIYNNRIHLDNNETIIRFFTGTLSDNSKIYISGNVANPLGLEGKIYMSTKYYDSRFNEIGICNDTIDLLGEGYSSISFACLISETDLMLDKKFSDVSYYKVSLHSLEIKE